MAEVMCNDCGYRHVGLISQQRVNPRLLPHHAMLVEEHSQAVVGWGNPQDQGHRAAFDKVAGIELACRDESKTHNLRVHADVTGGQSRQSLSFQSKLGHDQKRPGSRRYSSGF